MSINTGEKITAPPKPWPYHGKYEYERFELFIRNGPDSWYKAGEYDDEEGALKAAQSFRFARCEMFISRRFVAESRYPWKYLNKDSPEFQSIFEGEV